MSVHFFQQKSKYQCSKDVHFQLSKLGCVSFSKAKAEFTHRLFPVLRRKKVAQNQGDQTGGTTD
jgi:hypothetical protein